MNQSDYAKLHGVSRKTVSAWKARGWLVLDGDDVNVEASNANITRYRKTVTRPIIVDQGNKSGNKQGNKSQGNKTGNNSDDLDDDLADAAERIVNTPGALLSIDDARALKENFLARSIQLEYEVKAGKLLSYETILQQVAEEYNRVRTRLIAIAPEHGPRLRQVALSTDDVGFVAALRDIIYEAMEEMSLDSDSDGGIQQSG